MPLPREITIGQLSTRTGLSVPTLRYYEEQGLVRPNRTAGGQRRYPRSDIRRLSFVQILVRFGFTHREIRARLAKLPENRTPTLEDWSEIATELDSLLAQRIAEMERLKDRLTSCIGCGCLSLTACRLHNDHDHAGKDGPGARYVIRDNA